MPWTIFPASSAAYPTFPYPDSSSQFCSTFVKKTNWKATHLTAVICSVLFLNESLGHTPARHLWVNVSVACKRLLLALFHQPEKLQSSPLSTRYCSTTHTHTHSSEHTRTPLPSFCALSPPLSLSHREIPPSKYTHTPIPSPSIFPSPTLPIPSSS